MRRFSHQPSKRNLQRFSAMGKKSQEVQRARWEADADPQELADLAANPPLVEGDAIGAIQWTNFRTGKVTRWTVLRGDRTNNYRLRSPDGRESKPHGMAWILEKVRPVILTRCRFSRLASCRRGHVLR
jgi:hypothetical protein